MFEQTCSKCGAKFKRGEDYCPACGTPVAGRGGRTCRYCQAELAAADAFCRWCGRRTEGGEAPAMVGNTWMRGPDDFATRVEVDDLEGILQRDLIVEPGTRAIILRDGRNAGMVGPGRYTLRSFADRLSLPSLRGRATALLVDAGEVDLTLTVNDVYTADPLKIALDCHVVVSVADPMAFLTNLLKGAQSYGLHQLRAYLYDEIQAAAQECVGQRRAAEVDTNLALKQEFTLHIAAHLEHTLRQTGLQFSRVRAMNLRHARWSELAGQQEEYFLALTKEEADLAQRKRLFDVLDQKALQELFEEARKLLHLQQRNQVRDEMRRATLSDEFGELHSQRDREQFLREIDRQKLIADDEWDRLRRAVGWKVEDELYTRAVSVQDRDRDRAQVLARLKLEADYDLKQIELLQRSDLSQAELGLQISLARQRLDAEQQIEAQRQAFRLEQMRQEAAAQRARRELDDIERRQRELADLQQTLANELAAARTAAEIARLEREQDQADLELAMLALERMKAVQRKDALERGLDELRIRRERVEIELLAEERRVTMQISAQRAAHDQQMARDAQAQRFELDRLAGLKDLTPEAVVVAAGAEQGRLVADMQRTQAMKGMSEQQILAMAAANSPEAASALAEIARAAADGKLGREQVTMYERLLEQSQALQAEKEKSAQREAEAWKFGVEKVQETAHKAMDTTRDGMIEIAKATSHPPAQQLPPTVVVAGAGGIPAVVGGAPGVLPAGAAIQCRRCGTMAPVGTRFCTNCGYEFFATGGDK